MGAMSSRPGTVRMVSAGPTVVMPGKRGLSGIHTFLTPMRRRMVETVAVLLRRRVSMMLGEGRDGSGPRMGLPFLGIIIDHRKVDRRLTHLQGDGLDSFGL